jgi:hypothetical protein
LDSEPWQIVVEAAAGDALATERFTRLTHPLIDEAWSEGTQNARKEAAWRTLMASRTMGVREATTVMAGFFARDPLRTLPKIDFYRPVAVMVAEAAEALTERPTDNRGRPRTKGRVIWLLGALGSSGEISWPKIVIRAAPSDREIVARVARLTIRSQIDDFRATSPPMWCHLCGQVINGPGHVDHVVPFVDLLDDWLNKVGGESAVANAIENPIDGNPRFTDGDLEGSWFHWHRERAELAMAHVNCNLSRRRKQGP